MRGAALPSRIGSAQCEVIVGTVGASEPIRARSLLMYGCIIEEAWETPDSNKDNVCRQPQETGLQSVPTLAEAFEDAIKTRKFSN